MPSDLKPAAVSSSTHRGDQRHHFGAAGDDQIFHAGSDLRCGQARRGEAAAAETIERDAAGANVVTGIERGHATHVAALLALLRARAPDDVVDFCGIDVVALLQRLEDRRRQVLGMHFRQRTLAGLTNAPRRADSIDDVCFSHCIPLIRWRCAGVRAPCIFSIFNIAS